MGYPVVTRVNSAILIKCSSLLVNCSPRQSSSSRRPSTCCGPRSPPSTSFAWTYPVPRWRPDTSRLSVIRWQKSWTSYPATPGRRSVCLMMEIHYCVSLYREFHLLANLGWVDLDLGSSPGWWAGTVASFCPSRMVEHPKSKSTQPRFASR